MLSCKRNCINLYKFFISMKINYLHKYVEGVDKCFFNNLFDKNKTK